jgi:hypothetical protein
LAAAGQQAWFEPNDPIPEAPGISVRLVSSTARPRPIEMKPLEGSINRAGLFGYAGSTPGRRNAEIKNVPPPPCRSTSEVPSEVQCAGKGLTFPEGAPRYLTRRAHTPEFVPPAGWVQRRDAITCSFAMSRVARMAQSGRPAIVAPAQRSSRFCQCWKNHLRPYALSCGAGAPQTAALKTRAS